MVNFVGRKKKVKNALKELTWREKEKKTEELMSSFGLSYDKRRNILYEMPDKEKTGEGVSMLYGDVECETIPFFYNNCRWKLYLQKGQYRIATGGKLTIISEDTAQKLWIGFTLRKYGKVLFVQKGFQRNQTGFLLGEWSNKKNLSMDVEISFPNIDMCDAFLEGLYHVGYSREECRIMGNTIYFSFKRPKTILPIKDGSFQTVRRWWNQGVCRLYRWKTRDYRRTMERLLYLKEMSPVFFSCLFAQLIMKK